MQMKYLIFYFSFTLSIVTSAQSLFLFGEKNAIIAGGQLTYHNELNLLAGSLSFSFNGRVDAGAKYKAARLIEFAGYQDIRQYSISPFVNAVMLKEGINFAPFSIVLGGEMDFFRMKSGEGSHTPLSAVDNIFKIYAGISKRVILNRRVSFFPTLSMAYAKSEVLLKSIDDEAHIILSQNEGFRGSSLVTTSTIAKLALPLSLGNVYNNKIIIEPSLALFNKGMISEIKISYMMTTKSRGTRCYRHGCPLCFNL